MRSAERAELGAELRRRGMWKHLAKLTEWPPEHVYELLAFFQLPPADLELLVHQGRGCPDCGTGEHGAPAVRTMMTGPDRWLSGCDRCGARWLHLEPALTQRP